MLGGPWDGGPLIIIYTLYSGYLLGISPFKGLLGGLKQLGYAPSMFLPMTQMSMCPMWSKWHVDIKIAQFCLEKIYKSSNSRQSTLAIQSIRAKFHGLRRGTFKLDYAEQYLLRRAKLSLYSLISNFKGCRILITQPNWVKPSPSTYPNQNAKPLEYGMMISTKNKPYPRLPPETIPSKHPHQQDEIYQPTKVMSKKGADRWFP